MQGRNVAKYIRHRILYVCWKKKGNDVNMHDLLWVHYYVIER